MERELRAFKGGRRLNLIQRTRLFFWYPFNHVIFKSLFFPSILRPFILRIFGATIGKRVYLKRGIRIHFPWNLDVGDDCWVGEEVWVINHEKIIIGSNVCISQRSMICSGGHDYRSKSLEYSHAPITIKDGAWICLDAKVLPGVTIGKNSIVAAGEVVRNSISDNSMQVHGQVLMIDFAK